MTVYVHATYDAPTSTLIYSGDGEDGFEFEYRLTNCPTSPTAYTTLLAGNGAGWAGLPGMIDGYLLRTIQMRPDGPDIWVARCTYGEPKKKEKEQEKLETVGEYRISFSTKGQTVTQYYAASTTAYTRTPFAAPDYGGAINVNEDGEIEGVDVIVPSLTFTVTQRMSGASLTTAYMQTVAGLTGKTNNATFFGFPQGSLQFLGGDGALSFDVPNPNPAGPTVTIPKQDRELSFDFLFSPNLTGITIDGITGINKKGHQYLWALWYDTIVSDVRAKRARCIYVQTLRGQEEADLTALGIGP